MSDTRKQTVTIALIAVTAVLLCIGLVLGAMTLFGGVRTTVGTSVPTVISPTDGVFIQTVFPGSPAEAANLRPGHIIVRLNDDPVTSPEMLTLLLQNLPAGEAFTLLVRDEAGEIWQTTAVQPQPHLTWVLKLWICPCAHPRRRPLARWLQSCPPSLA